MGGVDAQRTHDKGAPGFAHYHTEAVLVSSRIRARGADRHAPAPRRQPLAGPATTPQAQPT